MKYLVNRETKEHKIANDTAIEVMERYQDFWEDFELVEADSEGWIPWSGGECPLPDNHDYTVKTKCGLAPEIQHHPQSNWWGNDGPIIAYKPILTKQSEPETVETIFDDESEMETIWRYVEDNAKHDVFHRLHAASSAAASIPSIIAEIDELLGPDYQVVRVEKVEATAPQEDMGDWRNWKPGDRIVCDLWNGTMFKQGEVYEIDNDCLVETEEYDFRSKIENFIGLGKFRFHSRPTGATK